VAAGQVVTAIAKKEGKALKAAETAEAKVKPLTREDVLHTALTRPVDKVVVPEAKGMTSAVSKDLQAKGGAPTQVLPKKKKAKDVKPVGPLAGAVKAATHATAKPLAKPKVGIKFPHTRTKVRNERPKTSVAKALGADTKPGSFQESALERDIMSRTMAAINKASLEEAASTAKRQHSSESANTAKPEAIAAVETKAELPQVTPLAEAQNVHTKLGPRVTKARLESAMSVNAAEHDEEKAEVEELDAEAFARRMQQRLSKAQRQH